MTYIVETVYPYRFYSASTEEEAMGMQKELKKKVIRSSIVVKTDGENDLI